MDPTTATIADADEKGQAQSKQLTWSVHLLRQQPNRLPKIICVLGLVFLSSIWLFHSLWLALLPTLAALFSVSEFVFPIHYTLTPESAAMKCGLTALEIQWADVRHAYLTDEGIKLSPLRRKNSRMEPLRGVYLRFDEAQVEAQREEVIATVTRLRQRTQ